MTEYDPHDYWTAAPKMDLMPAHALQELDLLDVLDRIVYPFDGEPTSILEIGIGFGRIADLLTGMWPKARYVGIDISPDRIADSRLVLPGRVELFQADLLEFETSERFDLVVAVEVLMHVRPDDLGEAVRQLRRWSKGHVVTVDWTEPIEGPIAPWNFLHDYEAHELKPVAKTGQQTIFTALGRGAP